MSVCVFACTHVGEWACGCMRACVYMCGGVCAVCVLRVCCVCAACEWVCVRQRASTNAAYHKECCVLKSEGEQCFSVLQCAAVCCGALQCICGVLRCVTVWCRFIVRNAACYNSWQRTGRYAAANDPPLP